MSPARLCTYTAYTVYSTYTVYSVYTIQRYTPPLWQEDAMSSLLLSFQRDVECAATTPYTSPMTRTHPPTLAFAIRHDPPAITVLRRWMAHR